MTTSATRVTPSASAPTRRPHRARRVLVRLLVAGLVLLLLALGVIWKLGPRYDLYLVPPSPQAYAKAALDKMNNGYYATGPRWERARQQAVAETKDAKTYADTIPALRKAVAVAGGKHSHVYDAGKDLASTDTARPLPTISTREDVTTVTVPTMSADDHPFIQKYADTLANGIAAAAPKSRCGFIVDLRHNHGGSMDPMLAGLSPLLTDGRIGGFVTRTGRHTDLTLTQGSIAQGGSTTLTVADHAKVTTPVAVITGPDNGSAGEVAVLAFIGQRNAVTFGQPTAGYTTANQTFRLYDGTGLQLTTGLDQDRTGRAYDGAITPERRVAVDRADEAARAWLTGQCHR